MQTCLCTILAAAIAFAPVPSDPASTFRQLEARMQEHVEQRRFETLAREAEAAYGRRDLSPEQRRVMAFFAVRGLHGMWEVARQPAGLCQARNLLRRVEREIGFANDRNFADRLRQTTEMALQETGLRNPCAPARATPGHKLPLASAPPLPSAQPATQPTPERPEAVPQDMDPEPGAAPPLLAATSLPRPDEAAEVGAPVAVAPAEGARPLPAIAAPARRRAPLTAGRIAGGSALLLAGTGGWVGVAFLLEEANDINAALQQRKLELDGTVTEMDDPVVQGLVREHEKLTGTAAAIGTASGLMMLGGVLLLALPVRRPPSVARPWLGPTTAGVSLAGRF